MITLPIALEKFMKGQDLTGLKPFALLYRNKWDSVNNTYSLDTANPIDISGMILKPNTLSMTLDVNEVAQYNANNVTLSLSDTENRFVEGTPNSYFPAGYQLYGSKVVLYYGITSPINPYPTQVGYTVVGSPTITYGVASGFSVNDYINLSSTLTSFDEIVVSFIPGTYSSGRIVLFKTGVNAYRGSFNWASNSTARFTYTNTSNGGAFLKNIPYTEGKENILKIKYVSTNSVKLTLSRQGESDFIRTITNIDIPATFGGDIYFGRGTSAYNAFNGSIDLNKTYIKANGEYWFNGAHFFYEPQATPLFTGVIKDLPTYKPENYQVDLKLVSPLEMLKDIEAKDFSDKVTGETLTYKSTDSDGHRIYWTSGTGVGGFDAVYANGVKLFEGVDYEISQLNEFGKPAILTIINSTHYSSAITVDYYVWKTNLTVEQIVEGLAGVAGYDSGTEDIRQVVWNTEVRTAMYTDLIASLGYKKEGNDYDFVGDQEFFNTSFRGFGPKYYSYSYLPKNFNISFSANSPYNGSGEMYYDLGKFSTPATEYSTGLVTGIRFLLYRNYNYNHIAVYQLVNGAGSSTTVLSEIHSSADVSINLRVRGNVAYLSGSTASVTYTFPTSFDWGINDTYNQCKQPSSNTHTLTNFSLTILDENENTINTLNTRGVIVQAGDGNARGFEGIRAVFSSEETQYALSYRVQNNNSWGNWKATSLGANFGEEGEYLQAVLKITNQFPTITAFSVFYLGSTLTLQLVNLSGLTVLEALQDFALISGYEFGVDRNGIFFFRPRVASTNPVYELGHNEVAKVETVKKNLSDFFTKLTLTFAEVPLEFYANKGTRPTAVDKYGIINKDIDKPDIVNYDNPELAQAIGPQLLEVYSALPNVIQAVGKLNLALELGDIVNLKRNLNLIADPEGSDFNKYRRQQTYYRACKITGMNYNFSKRQITYTLRDVSNSNNMPPIYAYGFPYDLPIQLGKLKTE